MADTRLPDVVPAKVLATSGKDSAELPAVVVVSGSATGDPSSVVGWHVAADRSRGESAIEPPIVVQIWSNSDTPDSPPPSCPSTPANSRLLDEEISHIEQHRRRSTSQHSDSGIESQLASPTVTDINLHHQKSFVLELSATHLTVPGRFRPSLTTASGTNACSTAHPENEDEAVQQPVITADDSDPSDSEKSESAPPTNSASSNSSGFLPQKRHHRNFLPVDLDGWRKRSDNFTKIRSLPTEGERNNASTDAADESAATGGSLSDSSSTPLATQRAKSDPRQRQLSPKICIEHDDKGARRKRDSGRSLDEQSTVSESRSVGSYSVGSEGSAADHDIELGSYYSSRQASVCSVHSESASIEQSMSICNVAPGIGTKRQRDEPSPTSRFNLLSVPSRNTYCTASSSDGNQRRTSRSALHSQLGSMSSLMNSRFSLSNSYLRLAMSGVGGMDDIMLVHSSVDEQERYGDTGMLSDEARFYECEQAAAQLSLTQRLAFPELVDADAELGHVRSKAYSRQNELPREESSLNFFAKIITFLVLVFVIVLVVGVLVKISHTPK